MGLPISDYVFLGNDLKRPTGWIHPRGGDGWKQAGKVLPVLVERKTMADLIQSSKGGTAPPFRPRLQNQLRRMGHPDARALAECPVLLIEDLLNTAADFNAFGAVPGDHCLLNEHQL